MDITPRWERLPRVPYWNSWSHCLKGGKRGSCSIYNRKEMLVRVPMTDTLNIKFTFYEEQGV